jgi:ligand-binding SRPBCC domain-containing protein
MHFEISQLHNRSSKITREIRTMTDIQINRQADGYYVLESEQLVPGTLEEVFGFFADARNLEQLTPPWLEFDILKSSTTGVEEGTTIDYRLGIHGIPMKWRSLISVWNPPFEFVDEQLKGPYQTWVHQHLFQAKEGGVLVTDRVRYKVIGGALIHKLFVVRDLRRIFTYRSTALKAIAERLANSEGEKSRGHIVTS